MGVTASPLRVLLSARDPAAAQNIAAVWQALAGDSRFRLDVVAQPPASTILVARKVPVRELPRLVARVPESDEARELLRCARAVLDEARPDVVLCSLSSPSPPEGGIDEALLATSGSPVLMLQDFWGEQNSFFGASPSVALVLDQHAADLTAARHGTPTRIVGSPRHGEFGHFDSLAARRRIRSRFGNAAPAAVYFGLFGQPLHRLPGYERTVRAWIAALRRLGPELGVIYRPHPREDDGHVRATEAWLQALDMPHVTLADVTPEEALAACDVPCTIFSNCAYDAAYLNRFSAEPLVSPVLMLFDEEMRGVLAATGDYRELPYISKGLSLPVWRAADLEETLDAAVRPEQRLALWRAARAALGDARLAVPNIADELLRRAGQAERTLA